eukprot:3569741-Amphidinium_carterae.1
MQAPHAQQSINASATRATMDQCKRHTRNNDTPQAPHAQQSINASASRATFKRTHHAALPIWVLPGKAFQTCPFSALMSQTRRLIVCFDTSVLI